MWVSTTMIGNPELVGGVHRRGRDVVDVAAEPDDERRQRRRVQPADQVRDTGEVVAQRVERGEQHLAGMDVGLDVGHFHHVDPDDLTVEAVVPRRAPGPRAGPGGSTARPRGAHPCPPPPARLADSDIGRPPFRPNRTLPGLRLADPRFHQCLHTVQRRRPASVATGRWQARPTSTPSRSSMSDEPAALLATPSGALVPVTAGPACLAPGGFGAPDQAALAPVLARWSELAGAPAIDLRAWHVAATAVDLRVPAADGVVVTPAQVAELDFPLSGPAACPAPPPRAQLARIALECR